MAATLGGQTTLIFLHYFGGSSRSWDNVTPHLGDRYACMTPDLPGFGSANDSPGPYTLDRYADDVADLVKVLGLQHYVVVGHSMGGKIALAFAARRPPGLAALLLLAPSPPSPEPMRDSDRAAMLAGHGHRSAATATLAKITARPLCEDVAERVVGDMLRCSGEAWTAWLESGSRQDITAAVDGLTVPTLVAVGAEDKAIAPEVQRSQTLPRLRNGRLVTLTGTGHLLPLEAPEAVADLIRTTTR